MRPLGLLFAWIATIFSSLPAYGWNATGHRVIAAIAYQRLTPKARARVDELLRAHPDYATLLADGAPTDANDAKGRALAAFLDASVWPDVIRGDRRFYDETRANAQPTPQIAGFPNMQSHPAWHYFDTPFSPDGTPTEDQKPPHALSELPRLLQELKSRDPKSSYDLPWLIHIESDVHQPLHAVSRFTKDLPHGDAGGNRVFVNPGGNLHSLWDGALGRDTKLEVILALATEVTTQFPQKHLSKEPRRWIAESFALCKTDVYTFGDGNGTRDQPIALPHGYEYNMHVTARRRIAMAGYRLAAILNERLK
jgi:hypothetical protein